MNKMIISDEMATDLPNVLDGMQVTNASIRYEKNNLIFTYYGIWKETGEEISREVTIPTITESEV